MRLRWLTALLLAPLSFSSFSSEIDNFSLWQERSELANARPVIDQQSRVLWDEALEDLRGKGCNESLLYKSLMKRFGNHVKSEAGKWLYRATHLPTHHVERHDSVYAALSLRESVMLSGFLARLTEVLRLDVGMGKLIRFDDHYIGIDKLEHFWATGASYFKKMALKRGGTLEDALAYGEKMENGILGAKTTGVYSYGDLAANFNGMRFWNHVLLKKDDVLGRAYNLGPYVACRQNEWKTVRYPKWQNYVDASWSEAHNCSKFRTQSMLDKVTNGLKNLQLKTGINGSGCPVDTTALRALVKKYSPTSYPELHRRLLNFRLGTVKDSAP